MKKFGGNCPHCNTHYLIEDIELQSFNGFAVCGVCSHTFDVSATLYLLPKIFHIKVVQPRREHSTPLPILTKTFALEAELVEHGEVQKTGQITGQTTDQTQENTKSPAIPNIQSTVQPIVKPNPTPKQIQKERPAAPIIQIGQGSKIAAKANNENTVKAPPAPPQISTSAPTTAAPTTAAPTTAAPTTAAPTITIAAAPTTAAPTTAAPTTAAPTTAAPTTAAPTTAAPTTAAPTTAAPTTAAPTTAAPTTAAPTTAAPTITIAAAPTTAAPTTAAPTTAAPTTAAPTTAAPTTAAPLITIAAAPTITIAAASAVTVAPTQTPVLTLAPSSTPAATKAAVEEQTFKVLISGATANPNTATPTTNDNANQVAITPPPTPFIIKTAATPKLTPTPTQTPPASQQTIHIISQSKNHIQTELDNHHAQPLSSEPSNHDDIANILLIDRPQLTIPPAKTAITIDIPHMPIGGIDSSTLRTTSSAIRHNAPSVQPDVKQPVVKQPEAPTIRFPQATAVSAALANEMSDTAQKANTANTAVLQTNKPTEAGHPAAPAELMSLIDNATELAGALKTPQAPIVSSQVPTPAQTQTPIPIPTQKPALASNAAPSELSTTLPPLLSSSSPSPTIKATASTTASALPTNIITPAPSIVPAPPSSTPAATKPIPRPIRSKALSEAAQIQPTQTQLAVNATASASTMAAASTNRHQIKIGNRQHSTQSTQQGNTQGSTQGNTQIHQNNAQMPFSASTTAPPLSLNPTADHAMPKSSSTVQNIKDQMQAVKNEPKIEQQNSTFELGYAHLQAADSSPIPTKDPSQSIVTYVMDEHDSEFSLVGAKGKKIKSPQSKSINTPAGEWQHYTDAKKKPTEKIGIFKWIVWLLMCILLLSGLVWGLPYLNKQQAESKAQSKADAIAASEASSKSREGNNKKTNSPNATNTTNTTTKKTSDTQRNDKKTDQAESSKSSGK